MPAGAAVETVQYDLAGRRVFCGFASKGYVVKLSNLDVKIPNRLELVVPSRIAVAVGQTLRLPLATNLPRGDAPAALTLDSSRFVQIEGANLVLAPGQADLGTHEVSVKASQAGLSDSFTMSIRVEVPNVNLGFTIRDLAVDWAQRSVIAWGRAVGRSTRRFLERAAQDLALIDLDSRKAGHAVAPGGIRFVAADDKYVFVVPMNPHILYRFDRTNLDRSVASSWAEFPWGWP